MKHHFEFDSFDAYLEGAERIFAAHVPGHYASGYDVQFYGSRTFPEAAELARKGWPEGWARMQALRDAIFGRMASRVQKTVVEFRQAGGAVNVGRFLSGRPDCFQARRQSHQVIDRRSQRVLRMVVNTGARAYVSADTFFMRGAIALTLIEALERSGLYRVQVDMVSKGLGGRGGTQSLELTTRLKNPTDRVQIDTMAFVLAHPALHRRLTFAYRYKYLKSSGGSVQTSDRGDIYIDAADTDAAHWTTADNAKAFVLQQLQRHGVALTEAA